MKSPRTYADDTVTAMGFYAASENDRRVLAEAFGRAMRDAVEAAASLAADDCAAELADEIRDLLPPVDETGLQSTRQDEPKTKYERASAAAEKFFATHTPEQVVAKFKESSTGTYLHSDAEIRAAAEARNEVAPSESDEKQARAIGLTLHEPLESREALLGGDYPEPSAAVRAWRARALNLEALLQSALSFLPEKGAGDHWEGCPSLRCEDEHGEDCAIETCPECDCAIGLSVRIRAALENDAAIDVLRELAVDKTAFPTNGEK